MEPIKHYDEINSIREDISKELKKDTREFASDYKTR